MSRNQTKITIQENVPLAPLTTLKVGGAARFFTEASTETEIIEAVSWAKGANLPLFVLGGGSNLVISDAGFQGLVLKIATRGITEIAEKDCTGLAVEAGENWDDFVAFCVARDFHGVECLSGIPGTVGAAPVQNIGAYGQEVSTTVSRVKCFDLQTGETLYLRNGKDGRFECGFAYRKSIFNTLQKNRYIILAVEFCFPQSAISQIIYKDLKNYFGDKKPNLREIRRAVLEIRKAKSMVIDENDPNSRSAGSFFKNPIVSVKEYEKINANFGGNVPFFRVDGESVKIPAAWLIEQSGFYKGFFLGNAAISEKHALAIINKGNAETSEIIALKEAIQAEVEKKFAIPLQTEPEFIGF